MWLQPRWYKIFTWKNWEHVLWHHWGKVKWNHRVVSKSITIALRLCRPLAKVARIVFNKIMITFCPRDRWIFDVSSVNIQVKAKLCHHEANFKIKCYDKNLCETGPSRITVFIRGGGSIHIERAFPFSLPLHFSFLFFPLVLNFFTTSGNDTFYTGSFFFRVK